MNKFYVRTSPTDFEDEEITASYFATDEIGSLIFYKPFKKQVSEATQYHPFCVYPKGGWFRVWQDTEYETIPTEGPGEAFQG